VLPARGALSAAQLAVWLGVLSIVMVTRVVWCEATGVESPFRGRVFEGS
jgi:hypothetical protein